MKTALSLQPGKSHIYYDPLGVTLIIGAWNYPYQLTLSPMVSAIAAGNTCMIKPSELPENTMHLLAELINNNFPSDYVYVAEGGIPETTELLKLRFDKIFFTGSPKVGKIVYEAAAKILFLLRWNWVGNLRRLLPEQPILKLPQSVWCGEVSERRANLYRS